MVLLEWDHLGEAMRAQRESLGTHHLVGGGIAALSAAVFLLRDAGVDGADIRIFEQFDRFGGSLDGSGGPQEGYLVRGGRMFEPHFACTFDLLETIPSADDPAVSAARDIFDFNRAVPGSSNCRLVRNAGCADVSLGLSAHDIVDINRLILKPERALKDRTIGSWFDTPFFETNFWLMWSTMFSFQPWHSAAEMRRYLRRFIHLFPGFSKIAGILRTRYNQYDSIVAPIVRWLEERGVRLAVSSKVLDIEIEGTFEQRRVVSLTLDDGRRVPVTLDDRVYITLGSMTDASTTGSNTAPAPVPATEGGSWELWRRLANLHAGLGNPDAFCSDAQKTTWTSFTVTLRSPSFFEFMERFSGNRTGTGGLVTFAGSGWILSVVMFHQPHFREQADGTHVFWGYGLRGDRPGDYVRKPMWDSSGDEVLAELAGQLGLYAEGRKMLDGATVVPCRMPHITSQFMPRKAGDRPHVRPHGSQNFAFIGQYCEMPRDTVFTVEYSVRSAMTAVQAMTGKGKPPPVARTDRDPLVLLRAARTLLGV